MAMRFQPGQILSTPGALEVVGHDVWNLLRRHLSGDWGDLGEDDWALNDRAVVEGTRILSAYVVNGKRIWIITEADRSQTTILLPEEY